MSRRGDGAPRPEPALTDLFSRAATVRDLKELIRSLNERGAEYILIGADRAVLERALEKLRGGAASV